jgi:predicted amidohydrolase
LSLRLAALQLAAHDRAGFPSAWPAIEAALHTALDEGAKLAVLPEATLPGYVMGARPFDEAETAAALERIQELARDAKAVVVTGMARTTPRGVTNSAVVIDCDGSIAGAADKHFLWHFDRQWFASADRIEPIRTSLGTIGALVCADGRIPLIARTLVEKGAQLLVMPTAWVTSGRDPAQLENVQADLFARVRARENGVPFLAANKCGTEQRCVLYCGKSQIVDADGTVAVIASQDRQEIVSATIALPEPRPRRGESSQPVALESPQNAMRIAITARALEDGDAERLSLVEAGRIVHPGDTGFASDEDVLDPGGLAALRLRGATLFRWKTAIDPQWQVTFARTRALELRVYIIVIDEQRRRAFAVDPDGAVVCGTAGSYEIAAFAFDPARTQMTLVAPGTDVLAGLQRAAADAAL